MTRVFSLLLLTVLLNLGLSNQLVAEALGYIKGSLQLDESWDKHVYLSFIETMERENAVSGDMIIASSAVDSLGQFSISLEKIPTTWSLLRLHIVKKGSPMASLVIGGLDENHCFLIAKQSSKIELENTFEKPVFDPITLSGASYMQTFNLINKLSDYSNSLDYESDLIESEFLEAVVNEKLKLIADTCNNSLVALYAVYKLDFTIDYSKDTPFYDQLLLKWEGEASPYFQSFRRQLPIKEESSWNYFLILLVLIVFVVIMVMLKKKQTSRIKSLTVQERKIFSSIRKGASNQEISDEFNIELSTVKSHVTNIYSKLKVKSRREAINLKIK